MQIQFATRTQAALFEMELKGQISDGMWENTPGTGWKEWCAATVSVGEPVGCRGYVPSKRGFAFKKLIPIIGDRMIHQAKVALAFPELPIRELDEYETVPDGILYTERQLRQDLDAINRTMKASWS